ncbi:MAG TPA: HAD family hydrolase [Gemmatimonadaceae bacterium]|nr:HAD family hydrolase [Gemmatimonadaceae bacterium]
MKLVLFDIDGTIMLSAGAGGRAVRRALVEVFGAPGPEQHRFDGKTDPQIVRELMSLAGHGAEQIDARMPALFERYLAYLNDELQVSAAAGGIRIMPGIFDLLDALEARDDVVLGLLTGNLAEGARAKLSAGGINPDRFRVGAYGSDHEVRGELPAVAQRRANEQLGLSFSGRDIVVIGDTPADLQCGVAIGCTAIGVATGMYSLEDLREHQPAAVFENLADTPAVVRAIIGEAHR